MAGALLLGALALLRFGLALRSERQPQPCPCLNSTERLALAASAVEAARAQGVGALQSAAAAAAGEWTAGMRAGAAQAAQELRAVAAGQLQEASVAVRVEDSREAAVVEAMLNSIYKAKGLRLAAVVDRAAEWGKSRAQNDLARLSESSFNTSRAEVEEAEAFRADAIGSAQTAAAVASKMVEAARDAQRVAQGLTNATAMRLVTSVGGENQAAIAQIGHALQLSQMAQNLVQQAKTLAGSALSRATSAEGSALQALRTARRNTMRIAGLKARVQAAQQRASAAR